MGNKGNKRTRQSLGRGIRVIVQRETTTATMENKDEKEKQMGIIIINKMHIVLTQKWGNNKTKDMSRELQKYSPSPPPPAGKEMLLLFFLIPTLV